MLIRYLTEINRKTITMKNQGKTVKLVIVAAIVALEGKRSPMNLLNSSRHRALISMKQIPRIITEVIPRCSGQWNQEMKNWSASLLNTVQM